MSVFFKVGSEICKACTNKSTAKYQYSFSKAERFPGTKLKTKEEKEKEKEEEEKRKKEEQEKIQKKQYIKHDYYLLPSTLNNRSTNFGFGERTDFTGSVRYNKLSKSQKINESQENKDNKDNKDDKENKVLTPEEQKILKEKQLYQFAEYEYERKYFHGPQYSIPRSGMIKIKTKKEEKEEKEENEENKNKKDDSGKDLVGPGRYNIARSFGSDAPKYSIKGIPDAKIEEMKKEVQNRIKEYNEKVSKEKKPIPPHEEQVTIQIRKNGRYASSTIPNVHSFRIEKPNKYLEEQKKKLERNKKEGEEEDKEEKEKEKEKEKIVDPLISDSKNYKEIKKYLNSLMGVNFQSKFRTHEAISFGKTKKVTVPTDNYPGPGSYLMPSEFGIYLTKDYNDEKKYPQENVFVVKKKEQDPHPWRHGMKKIKPKKEEEEPAYQEPENENQDQENQEQENQEQEKSPLPDNEPKEEEKPVENKDIDLDKDKESEYIMLRDILEYHDGN